MRATVIAVLIGAHGFVSKVLEKVLEVFGIGGQIDIFLPTALLKSARIQRRVLETRANLLLLKLHLKTIS